MNEKDEVNCVCKTCDKVEDCELHTDYEENHCENGTYPINACTIKDN